MGTLKLSSAQLKSLESWDFAEKRATVSDPDLLKATADKYKGQEVKKTKRTSGILSSKDYLNLEAKTPQQINSKKILEEITKQGLESTIRGFKSDGTILWNGFNDLDSVVEKIEKKIGRNTDRESLDSLGNLYELSDTYKELQPAQTEPKTDEVKENLNQIDRRDVINRQRLRPSDLEMGVGGGTNTRSGNSPVNSKIETLEAKTLLRDLRGTDYEDVVTGFDRYNRPILREDLDVTSLMEMLKKDGSPSALGIANSLKNSVNAGIRVYERLSGKSNPNQVANLTLDEADEDHSTEDTQQFLDHLKSKGLSKAVAGFGPYGDIIFTSPEMKETVTNALQGDSVGAKLMSAANSEAKSNKEFDAEKHYAFQNNIPLEQHLKSIKDEEVDPKNLGKPAEEDNENDAPIDVEVEDADGNLYTTQRRPNEKFTTYYTDRFGNRKQIETTPTELAEERLEEKRLVNRVRKTADPYSSDTSEETDTVERQDSEDKYRLKYQKQLDKIAKKARPKTSIEDMLATHSIGDLLSKDDKSNMSFFNSDDVTLAPTEGKSLDTSRSFDKSGLNENLDVQPQDWDDAEDAIREDPKAAADAMASQIESGYLDEDPNTGRLYEPNAKNLLELNKRKKTRGVVDQYDSYIKNLKSYKDSLDQTQSDVRDKSNALKTRPNDESLKEELRSVSDRYAQLRASNLYSDAQKYSHEELDQATQKIDGYKKSLDTEIESITKTLPDDLNKRSQTYNKSADRSLFDINDDGSDELSIDDNLSPEEQLEQLKTKSKDVSIAGSPGYRKAPAIFTDDKLKKLSQDSLDLARLGNTNPTKKAKTYEEKIAKFENLGKVYAQHNRLEGHNFLDLEEHSNLDNLLKEREKYNRLRTTDRSLLDPSNTTSEAQAARRNETNYTNAANKYNQMRLDLVKQSGNKKLIYLDPVKSRINDALEKKQDLEKSLSNLDPDLANRSVSSTDDPLERDRIREAKRTSMALSQVNNQLDSLVRIHNEDHSGEKLDVNNLQKLNEFRVNTPPGSKNSSRVQSRVNEFMGLMDKTDKEAYDQVSKMNMDRTVKMAINKDKAFKLKPSEEVVGVNDDGVFTLKDSQTGAVREYAGLSGTRIPDIYSTHGRIQRGESQERQVIDEQGEDLVSREKQAKSNVEETAIEQARRELETLNKGSGKQPIDPRSLSVSYSRSGQSSLGYLQKDPSRITFKYKDSDGNSRVAQHTGMPNTPELKEYSRLSKILQSGNTGESDPADIKRQLDSLKSTLVEQVKDHEKETYTKELNSLTEKAKKALRSTKDETGGPSPWTISPRNIEKIETSSKEQGGLTIRTVNGREIEVPSDVVSKNSDLKNLLEHSSKDRNFYNDYLDSNNDNLTIDSAASEQESANDSLRGSKVSVQYEDPNDIDEQTGKPKVKTHVIEPKEGTELYDKILDLHSTQDRLRAASGSNLGLDSRTSGNVSSSASGSSLYQSRKNMVDYKMGTDDNVVQRNSGRGGFSKDNNELEVQNNFLNELANLSPEKLEEKLSNVTKEEKSKIKASIEALKRKGAQERLDDKTSVTTKKLSPEAQAQREEYLAKEKELKDNLDSPEVQTPVFQAIKGSLKDSAKSTLNASSKINNVVRNSDGTYTVEYQHTPGFNKTSGEKDLGNPVRETVTISGNNESLNKYIDAKSQYDQHLQNKPKVDLSTQAIEEQTNTKTTKKDEQLEDFKRQQEATAMVKDRAENPENYAVRVTPKQISKVRSILDKALQDKEVLARAKEQPENHSNLAAEKIAAGIGDPIEKKNFLEMAKLLEENKNLDDRELAQLVKDKSITQIPNLSPKELSRQLDRAKGSTGVLSREKYNIPEDGRRIVNKNPGVAFEALDKNAKAQGKARGALQSSGLLTYRAKTGEEKSTLDNLDKYIETLKKLDDKNKANKGLNQKDFDKYQQNRQEFNHLLNEIEKKSPEGLSALHSYYGTLNTAESKWFYNKLSKEGDKDAPDLPDALDPTEANKPSELTKLSVDNDPETLERKDRIDQTSSRIQGKLEDLSSEAYLGSKGGDAEEAEEEEEYEDGEEDEEDPPYDEEEEKRKMARLLGQQNNMSDTAEDSDIPKQSQVETGRISDTPDDEEEYMKERRRVYLEFLNRQKNKSRTTSEQIESKNIDDKNDQTISAPKEDQLKPAQSAPTPVIDNSTVPQPPEPKQQKSSAPLVSNDDVVLKDSSQSSDDNQKIEPSEIEAPKSKDKMDTPATEQQIKELAVEHATKRILGSGDKFVLDTDPDGSYVVLNKADGTKSKEKTDDFNKSVKSSSKFLAGKTIRQISEHKDFGPTYKSKYWNKEEPKDQKTTESQTESESDPYSYDKDDDERAAIAEHRKEMRRLELLQQKIMMQQQIYGGINSGGSSSGGGSRSSSNNGGGNGFGMNPQAMSQLQELFNSSVTDKSQKDNSAEEARKLLESQGYTVSKDGGVVSSSNGEKPQGFLGKFLNKIVDNMFKSKEDKDTSKEKVKDVKEDPLTGEISDVPKTTESDESSKEERNEPKSSEKKTEDQTQPVEDSENLRPNTPTEEISSEDTNEKPQRKESKLINGVKSLAKTAKDKIQSVGDSLKDENLRTNTPTEQTFKQEASEDKIEKLQRRRNKLLEGAKSLAKTAKDKIQSVGDSLKDDNIRGTASQAPTQDVPIVESQKPIEESPSNENTKPSNEGFGFKPLKKETEDQESFSEDDAFKEYQSHYNQIEDQKDKLQKKFERDQAQKERQRKSEIRRDSDYYDLSKVKLNNTAEGIRGALDAWRNQVK